MPSVLQSWLRLLMSLCLLTLTGCASGRREYVILSGGPALRGWEEYRTLKDRHDRYWGNFIKSARIRIDQLRRERGGAFPITWLVYRPAYETREREDAVKRPPELCTTAEITSLAASRGARLIWFEDKDFIIDYLNRHRGGGLTGFEYFGHSNMFAFLPDYSNDILGVSSCYLHSLDLRRLHRGIFAGDAHVRSWGCNTGDFMSRVWKKRTGHPMIGAAKTQDAAGNVSGSGKTDYSAISDGVSLPAVDGRWVD
ncbi:MAG: hypothetical protein EOP86_01445 [Verrucomicrobiaceae bacterium]|nr:MAG: hypothetical protein EOP86_01445 [Verrucomicrobiaceae bacterium]